MKQDQPGPGEMTRYGILVFRLLLFAGVAVILWAVQDFAASFAAREMTTETRLRTVAERDDARVQQAFDHAAGSVKSTVRLVTEPDPGQQTRDATLTLTAPSKREVLEDRAALVQAMQTEFSRGGPGELFDMGNTPHAVPVPNERMALIRSGFRWGAGLVMLAGLGSFFQHWKRSRLPVGALLGALATVFTVFLAGEHDSTAALPVIIALVPAGILALVVFLTLRVQKAARWQEGRARIIRSRVEAKRHRFSGDTTKVKNLPSVAYQFKIGDQMYQGDRISMGMAPADNVDVLLKRYAVGKEVPVFYDPGHPANCVLERRPPVSLGCLWAGTSVVLLVYTVVALSLWHGQSINGWIRSQFPQARHPLTAALAGPSGLLLAVIGLWNRLHPRKMFPWLRTPGMIVSSEVEAYQENLSSSSHAMRRFYKAVIEFRYEVGGLEYHNILGAGAPVTVSVSGDQASAEAAVAQYPAGTPVEVFYNPAQPTQSGLGIDTERMITGSSTLLVGSVLLAVAVYAAMPR